MASIGESTPMYTGLRSRTSFSLGLPRPSEQVPPGSECAGRARFCGTPTSEAPRLCRVQATQPPGTEWSAETDVVYWTRGIRLSGAGTPPFLWATGTTPIGSDDVHFGMKDEEYTALVRELGD